MAKFAPVLAIGATLLTGGAAAPFLLAGGLAARQSYVAGKQAQYAYKLEAKQEADAARGREIDRKRNLLRALATQNAAAGAQGVAFSGGKAAIARSDIREAVDDLMTDRANVSRRAFALRSAGKSANKQGKIGAVNSLLDTAGNLFGLL